MRGRLQKNLSGQTKSPHDADEICGSMNERSDGIVVLDVGGTQFTSSVTTLASSSSYFERRLSKEWQGKHPETRAHIVIDQDPHLFSILLSYMRLGSIEADKLTTPVILLAMFFGMDQLLDAVRIVAIRSKFEGKKLAIYGAAQAALLVRENDVKKKFASLTICHPEFVAFSESRGVDPDFVVFVEIQNKDGTVHRPSNYFTFVDALNYLSKSGYTRYEKEKFEPSQSYSACIARMWFSKLIVEDHTENMNCSEDFPWNYFASETNSIRESDTSIPKKYPREYCCIIDNDENGDELNHMDSSILEADIGVVTQKIEISGHFLDQPTTGEIRSAVLDDIDSKIKIFNWLQNQGYTTREKELESAYATGIKIFNPKRGNHVDVTVWSRPVAVSR